MQPTESPLSADELLRQGLAFSQANQVDAACECFERAAEREPRSGLPHFLIGAELAQQGRMDEAEMRYANAVLLSPELEMARYQLGLIQFTSGRPALALVTWQPLFSLPPNATLRLVVQGFAALAQDELERAAQQFSQAMASNTDNLPLNRDLQVLLDRIHATSAAIPLPTADATDSLQSEEQDAEHVFLNNYRHSGPAH